VRADAGGNGTIMGTAAAVAKGMVGSGVLSMSAGVAAFTRSPEGLLLAMAMLAGFTLISAYTFQLVAWVSAATNSRDLGEAWAQTVGTRYIWIPRIAVCVISAVSCIIYAMLLGDLLSSILYGALETIAGGGFLEHWKGLLLQWCHRGPVLATLTVTVLLPLCLQEQFANLSVTSLVGLAASCYLAGFTLWRCLDGSYLPGGRFFSLAPMTPAALVPAQSVSDVVNLRSLVLLSNFGMAYMNHGMAPATFQELATPGDAPPSCAARLRRYRWVTSWAFILTGVICTTVMVAGFQTFGSRSAGNLLANYANTDHGATLARVCVMVSVLFGFPLNFVVLRTELAAAWKLDRRGRQTTTVVLLASFVVMALVLGDLGQVQAVCGAVLGSFVVYTAPAIMARALRKKGGLGGRRQAAIEVLLLGVGAVVTSVGLAVSLFR